MKKIQNKKKHEKELFEVNDDVIFRTITVRRKCSGPCASAVDSQAHICFLKKK